MAKNVWAYNCLNTILLASVFLSFFNRCLQKSVLNTFISAVSASQIFIMKIALIGVSYNQEKHPLCFCFLARGEIFHSKQNIEKGDAVKILEIELIILFSSFICSCFYLTLKLKVIVILQS